MHELQDDLSPLYEELPPALRGVVELVYDVNNNPQLRFMEALLYRTDLYRAARQSIDLSLDDGSEPPFILSTPRLPHPGHLQLPLQLNDPGIDELFATRLKPQPFDRICDALKVRDGESADALRRLLTTHRREPAKHPPH